MRDTKTRRNIGYLSELKDQDIVKFREGNVTKYALVTVSQEPRSLGIGKKNSYKMHDISVGEDGLRVLSRKAKDIAALAIDGNKKVNVKLEAASLRSVLGDYIALKVSQNLLNEEEVLQDQSRERISNMFLSEVAIALGRDSEDLPQFKSSILEAVGERQKVFREQRDKMEVLSAEDDAVLSTDLVVPAKSSHGSSLVERQGQAGALAPLKSGVVRMTFGSVSQKGGDGSYHNEKMFTLEGGEGKNISYRNASGLDASGKVYNMTDYEGPEEFANILGKSSDFAVKLGVSSSEASSQNVRERVSGRNGDNQVATRQNPANNNFNISTYGAMGFCAAYLFLDIALNGLNERNGASLVGIATMAAFYAYYNQGNLLGSLQGHVAQVASGPQSNAVVLR